MKINKKRIRNIDCYLSSIEDNTIFRVVFDLNGHDAAQILAKVGFALPTATGDTILPTPKGPVSRFNADGKWNIDRDLPKEERYIRTVKWQWKQWCGRDEFEQKEEEKDIYRDCYQREFVPPPAIELTYIEHDGRRLIISPVCTKLPENSDNIRHIINLFLELFDECELVHDDLTPFVKMNVRRLNWRPLPPGEYPWDQLEGHLLNTLNRTSKNMQELIIDRQKTICGFDPVTCYIGLGGFSDYIAYVFEKIDLVVLESIRKDNAIYVFGRNWQEFAKLSKAEVLSNNHHQARIIHAKGWKTKVAELLSN